MKRFFFALLITLFASVAAAQTPYRALPGDTVTVEVLEDASLNRSVVILPDGSFSFPFAGSVQGAGRTGAQIEASITSAIASSFATPPTVFVTLQPKEREPVARAPAAPLTYAVFFLGEVNTPGQIEVEPGTTFLQAVAQSGGLTRFAATKRIQLRRTDPGTGQPSIILFNYKALTDGAQLDRDIQLRDGDVILVPERRLFE